VCRSAVALAAQRCAGLWTGRHAAAPSLQGQAHAALGAVLSEHGAHALALSPHHNPQDTARTHKHIRTHTHGHTGVPADTDLTPCQESVCELVGTLIAPALAGGIRLHRPTVHRLEQRTKGAQSYLSAAVQICSGANELRMVGGQRKSENASAGAGHLHLPAIVALTIALASGQVYVSIDSAGTPSQH